MSDSHHQTGSGDSGAEYVPAGVGDGDDKMTWTEMRRRMRAWSARKEGAVRYFGCRKTRRVQRIEWRRRLRAERRRLRRGRWWYSPRLFRLRVAILDIWGVL